MNEPDLSLDEILLKEHEEELFEDCIEAMQDTPLDRLFGVPDLNDLIENINEEDM